MRETHIRARVGWSWINWRELWQARDLIVLLARRDLVTKYAQTMLGPLWFALQPLGLAIVLSAAINGGAGSATEGVPSFLFNLCSVTPWFYFSQTFGVIGTTFVNNGDLFQKVYFPRSSVPLAVALANLASLLIQTVMLMVVLIVYHYLGLWKPLSWRLMLIPCLYVELVIFTLGAGLLIASLTARYRDLVHAMQYLVLIAMFASSVFVPMSSSPSHVRWLLWFNPLAAIVETMRSISLNISGIAAPQLTISLGISVAMLVLGLFSFERASRTAVDLA